MTVVMTADGGAALVRRMQECFNTRAFERAVALHTPGFVCHPLGTTGPEAGQAAWRALVSRYPDIRVTAEDVLVDGDRIAARSVVHGIGAPPDDGPAMLFEIFRVEDGRFAEMWGASTGFPAAAAPEDVTGTR